VLVVEVGQLSSQAHLSATAQDGRSACRLLYLAAVQCSFQVGHDHLIVEICGRVHYLLTLALSLVRSADTVPKRRGSAALLQYERQRKALCSCSVRDETSRPSIFLKSGRSIAMPRQARTVQERVVAARRESRDLDFKDHFDPDQTPECIELVKDIIAMANSGGGLIVIGVCDDGTVSGADVKPALDLDPAKLGDKIHKYTGIHFADFEIVEAERDSKRVAALVIGPSPDVPIIFTSPGNYAVAGNKQKTAFSVGTVYFRHGAKSEPGNTADLRNAMDRKFNKLREEWIDRVRQIVLAPEGAKVALVTASDENGIPTRIRLTSDPDAIVYGRLDPDQTHPYRLTELLQELNQRLPPGSQVNSHDLKCVRKVHDISEETYPEFTHWPMYSSPQYSDEFVDWLIGEYETDGDFFLDARDKYRSLGLSLVGDG
jgi:hypothetical protein